jgi:tripartite ATP-independent transporter DctP family solute receptor
MTRTLTRKQFAVSADQSNSSPVTARAREMWKAVERETGGRLSVATFPDSQLGGDSSMLAQLRSGAIQFLTLPGAILGGLVPAAQVVETAFAFKDERLAFAAVDGELGEFVRREIASKGLFCLPHPWSNAFRQVTANKPIRTVADLEGLRIRVPVSPLFIDLFRTLGASPTPINISELYTALQTHVVDAQENALINIEQSNIFEVQKTLNFSNHAWSCWWFLVNQEAWNSLPHDVQDTVTRNVTKYATLQRRDSANLTAALTDKLRRQGMQEFTCDTNTFRAKLGPYYAKWKDTFGPTAWSVLEKYSGKLG